jgi:hypothetical protein
MKPLHRIRRLFRLPSWYFGPQLFGAYAPLGLIMEFVFFVVFLASMHLLRRDKWVEGFE